MLSDKMPSPGAWDPVIERLTSQRDVLTDDVLRAEPQPNLLNRSLGWAFLGLMRTLHPYMPSVVYSAHSWPQDEHLWEPSPTWRKPHFNQVVGFGVGINNGKDQPELIVFGNKVGRAVFALAEQMSRSGTPTSVMSGVRFQAATRPVKGGHSIGFGSVDGASGTMGCVVRDRSNGLYYALSCNHVIANLNMARRWEDIVWAPSSKRSGTIRDRLGVLYDFQEIVFGNENNFIDAALAHADDPEDLATDIDNIGQVTGINRNLSFGDPVKKMGAASGYTTGKYRYEINAHIEYPNGRKALFRNLVGIVGLDREKNFAAQGDSGAVVLDLNNAIVAQIISVGVGVDLTLASPIHPVLERFRVDPI